MSAAVLTRRQMGLAALAGTIPLLAVRFGVHPAAAQLGGARVDRAPSGPESDQRRGPASPEPSEGPRSEEGRRGGSAVPEGGAESEAAPDEPAPRGCPVNDRKLELIV